MQVDTSQDLEYTNTSSTGAWRAVIWSQVSLFISFQLWNERFQQGVRTIFNKVTFKWSRPPPSLVFLHPLSLSLPSFNIHPTSLFPLSFPPLVPTVICPLRVGQCGGIMTHDLTFPHSHSFSLIPWLTVHVCVYKNATPLQALKSLNLWERP